MERKQRGYQEEEEELFESKEDIRRKKKSYLRCDFYPLDLL
jgi:hypothetical protein